MHSKEEGVKSYKFAASRKAFSVLRGVCLSCEVHRRSTFCLGHTRNSSHRTLHQYRNVFVHPIPDHGRVFNFRRFFFFMRSSPAGKSKGGGRGGPRKRPPAGAPIAQPQRDSLPVLDRLFLEGGLPQPWRPCEGTSKKKAPVRVENGNCSGGQNEGGGKGLRSG